MNQFILAILTFALATQACAQASEDGSNAEVKLVKVSQRKLQTATIKALVEGKAKFHGVASCEERCGGEPGETDYDSESELYSYSVPKSKLGGLVAIVTAEKNPIFLQKYFVLPLSDCAGFFRELRALRKPVVIGDAPFRLTVEYGMLSMNANKVDFMKQMCRKSSEPGGGMGLDIVFQSFVGPVVNVSEWRSDESDNRSKNSFAARMISWNLKENRRAELTDLFEKESVLKALKADKVMRQRFFKGRVQSLEQATELPPLMRAIELDPRQFGERMGWEILSYDPKLKTANVHMGFYGDCCNSTKIFRIGLNLQVRPELESVFESSKHRGWIKNESVSGRDNKPADFERALNNYISLSAKEIE